MGLAVLASLVLLAGCGTNRKHIEIELGEGGSAQLDITGIKGVVHGPFRYKSTVAVARRARGARGPSS